MKLVANDGVLWAPFDRTGNTMLFNKTMNQSEGALSLLTNEAADWLRTTGFNFRLAIHEFGDYAWLIFETKEEATLFKMAYNLS